MKGLAKTGWILPSERINLLTISTFDRWVAKNLDECDILHHWSSCGVVSQQVVKQRWNSRIVCERGSSHIAHQNQILVDEHDRWSIQYRPTNPRIIERELQEYEGADRIVVPSSFAARSFLERGFSADKLAIVPFGVNLDVFRPIPKGDGVFRVLYVGQMSLRKGLPYMLEAVAGLSIPKLEFWLIGSLSSEAETFFKRYEGSFRYLGMVPRHELYQYYSQASVLVLASLEEGMAMVQAQAMACGLPVISTTNSGGEDLFQDGVEGFIVPIRSPEAIRDKIVYLYEHPDRRQEMAQAAMKCVQGMGGWERYGDQMTDLYTSLLQESV